MQICLLYFREGDVSMCFPGKQRIPWALVIAASSASNVTWQSVALCLLLSCSCCIFGHSFFEGERNLTLNSTLSVNMMVCTGYHWATDDLFFRDAEHPTSSWVSDDSSHNWPQRLVPLDWCLPLTSSPESCGCKVVGHFPVPNLFPRYHNPLAPTPHSLALLWAEIYTQEMENMTFCLSLCVCIISLIWN